MLVSLNWLKDYVDIELTSEELAHRLTMAGLEVDDVRTVRPNFSGVVVAKILSVRLIRQPTGCRFATLPTALRPIKSSAARRISRRAILFRWPEWAP